jgi:hypothetical protein
MAQTGYTPILIYGSTTASAVPLAADLTTSANGVELALNAADGKLFYKDSGGTVRVLASTAGIVAGSNTQIQFNNSGVLGASAGLTWDGTNLTASQVRSSGLTSGRVTFAGASGLLSDSTNLTWNGSALGVTGAINVSANSTFSSTGALTISKGNTSERPSPVSGMLRFNTQTSEFEGYNGAAWASVGGAALSNDTSTSTNVFPLFASATTGTASTLFTSNAQYLFKPSTGELSVKAPRASNGIVVNSATVTSDYTIATGDNGMSAGPVTVNSGITVTVSSGSVWTVV